MYKKRGISPLITAVLLLGLVISLATVGIIWSQRSIRTTMGKAEQSQMKLSCATDVSFDVLSACYTRIGKYKAIEIKVRNNKDKPINAGFMVRIVGENTELINTEELNPSSPITTLEANAVITFTVPHNVKNIQKISVIPKIRSEKSYPTVCSGQALNLKIDGVERIKECQRN